MRAARVPGVVAVTDAIPRCAWDGPDCTDGGEGRYDFRTVHGAWANGCRGHFAAASASNELGVGHGQYLVTEGEVGTADLPAFVVMFAGVPA